MDSTFSQGSTSRSRYAAMLLPSVVVASITHEAVFPGDVENELDSDLAITSRPEYLRLPLLDCDGDPTWSAFRKDAQDIARAPTKQSQIDQIRKSIWTIVELVERWQAAELQREAIHRVSFEQALEEPAGSEAHRIAESFCIFGAVTAMYLYAWAISWGIFSIDKPGFEARPEAMRMLRAANWQLRMNDLDMLEDSSWPWSSWDILRNLARARSGYSFLGRPARLGCCFGREARKLQIPNAWPQKSMDHHSSEVPHRDVSVFWTGMHFVVFLDVLSVLRDAYEWWRGTVTIKNHCLASSTYCSYVSGSSTTGNLCSTDERFRSLMRDAQLNDHSERQWGGVKDFNSHQFEDARREFQLVLWPELKRDNIALLMCGHPLFWCGLFEGLEDVGVLGLVDEPHTLFLSEDVHDSWTARMHHLFANPRWLLVTWASYHALQMRWATGINPTYVRSMALHIKSIGVYEPTQRPYEVLISPLPTRHVISVLLQAAAVRQPQVDGHLLEFRRWPEDLPCGAQCPKEEFAKFRCGVLWPYDVFTMKFAELYAIGLPLFVQRDLWRWSMRWSMTDATNKNASTWRLRDRVPANLLRPTAAEEEAEEEMDMDMESHRVGRRRVRFEYARAAPLNWWREPWPAKEADMDHWYFFDKGVNETVGPFGPLPSSPFSADRHEPEPLGRAFWAGLTEHALRPHLVYFSSVWDLVLRLESTSLEDLRSRSSRMEAFHRRGVQDAKYFWQQALRVLMDPAADTSILKGPTWRRNGSSVTSKYSGTNHCM